MVHKEGTWLTLLESGLTNKDVLTSMSTYKSVRIAVNGNPLGQFKA